MGLLSRSTKSSKPGGGVPPPISAPLPASQQYLGGAGGSSSNDAYGVKKVYSSATGLLPSPPGSPIEAQGRGYTTLRPAPTASYTNRPQQTQPQHLQHQAYPSSNGSGNGGGGGGGSAYRSAEDSRGTSSGRIANSQTGSNGNNSFSSTTTTNSSNVLYNDMALRDGDRNSSLGTIMSDRDHRDVEGKMGNLGLSNQPSHLNSQQRYEGDDGSMMSVEMADGNNTGGAGTGYSHHSKAAPQQQRPQAAQQQQQQQQQQRVPTQQSSNTSYGGEQQQQQLTPSRGVQQLQRVAGTAPQNLLSSPSNASILSPTPSASSSASRKTSSRYNLSDFSFIRTLGTGSFGRVHLVRSQHNSRSYAVKVLSKDRVVKMKQVEHTNSEREMLERVRHPFLVNLWGTFKDSKNLYMVMDFVAGGELFSLLRKSQRFPDPVAKFFAAEVALALDYLHSLDIIYRDLKPENILLGADGHVKITDFGFAKHVPDITWTLCGTPDYLAPEIVQSRGYNKSVDWYAMGVLMFEMLAGYPPFFTEDSNPMRLYEKIISGKVRYPAYFAPEAKDLLKSLLTPDITKRFGNLANGSRDIFGHVWFQEVDWERLYRKEIPAPYVPKVEGDWDASNFDQYPEVDLSEYGSTGPDPHGHLFTSF